MRVITGTARGRKLREPSGMDIRPTTDVVKEAVFNIIQFDIEGRRVLDLFAGTGQLGIEALSRGAADCVFVDESREAVSIVKENLAKCRFTAKVVQTDSIGYLRGAGKFDMIFLDPILTEGGIIVCESRREKSLPEPRAPYVRTLERNYGKVKISVYKRKSDL